MAFWLRMKTAAVAMQPAAVQRVSNDPLEQVAATIALMRSYATEDAASPPVTAAAATALALFPDLEPAAASFWFVKRALAFQTDDVTARQHLGSTIEPIIETLIRPRDILLTTRTGDCDDFSMLLASMLTVLRVPWSYVTVAADPDQPGVFSHVYVAAYPLGERLPLDASHGPHPNWETHGDRREWPGALMEQDVW